MDRNTQVWFIMGLSVLLALNCNIMIKNLHFSSHIHGIPPLEDHQWRPATGVPLSADFQFGSIFSSRDLPLAECLQLTPAIRGGLSANLC